MTAINRVRDAYMKRVEQKNTEQAIRQLQTVVENLAEKVEKTTHKSYEGPALSPYSYAAAAGRGLPTQTRPQQSLNATHVTLQKLVPTRHKREIIVVRGTKTAV